jgi:hypothetical protein
MENLCAILIVELFGANFKKLFERKALKIFKKFHKTFRKNLKKALMNFFQELFLNFQFKKE